MRISDWSSDVCSSDLADQQVAPVLVGGRQAETPERPAGLDVVAFVQALEQRGRGAAGNVADRDFHGIAGTQRMVVDRRQQIGRATSELQSLLRISYAVFCLKKKHNINEKNRHSHNR